jgi:LDH2 family malate/lactate/ureidoglycolate dehydrogenase
VGARGLAAAQPAAVAVVDTDALAIVDGNRGFGQVIGEFARELGIAKAAKRASR